MPAVTIRNLTDETHRALKLRAEQHGRSTETEIRDILETAVHPRERVKLGSELAAFGRQFGELDLDTTRDPTPAAGQLRMIILDTNVISEPMKPTCAPNVLAWLDRQSGPFEAAGVPVINPWTAIG